jgi:hypothetical protein
MVREVKIRAVEQSKIITKNRIEKEKRPINISSLMR